MKNNETNNLDLLIKNKLPNVPFKDEFWNVGSIGGKLISDGIDKLVDSIMN
jgi:hypothetical protein